MQLIRERLEAEAGRSLDHLFDTALPLSPDPIQSLLMLEAWSPTGDFFESLDAHPEISAALMRVSGAYPALASALAKLPDAANFIGDIARSEVRLQGNSLREQARRMSTDPSLLKRFKLQYLAIVMVLAESQSWDPLTLEVHLQTLADALVDILAEGLWTDYGQEGPTPGLKEGAEIPEDRQSQVLAFYEGLAEVLERLEDHASIQMAGQIGRRLDSILRSIRRRIQGLPASLLGLEAPHPDARAEVLRRLGPHGAVASRWLDAFPDRVGLYESLVADDRGLLRIQILLSEGPSLIPSLQKSQSLTERVLQGELSENFHPDTLVRELTTSCTLNTLADTFREGWHEACARWLFESTFDLGSTLSDLTDALLEHCAHRLYLDFDIVALGSYGRREVAPGSDADVLFLVQDVRLQAQTNQQAADLLALAAKLNRLGAPVKLDVRMHEETGDRLVRTFDEFLIYELEEMQMWQRFELGMARGIIGSEDAVAVATKAAYAQPLTPERLKELLDLKRRIETSELKPQYRGRDIKLGEGALGDLEWFVHIMEMRYPTATRAGEHVLMEDRIRAMGRARLLNAIEVHELLLARTHLLELRNRLELLGIGEDVLPENPGKLEALAVRLEASDANDLLLRHERLTKTVRAIYTEGMEELKAW